MSSKNPKEFGQHRDKFWQDSRNVATIGGDGSKTMRFEDPASEEWVEFETPHGTVTHLPRIVAGAEPYGQDSEGNDLFFTHGVKNIDKTMVLVLHLNDASPNQL
jgi:hypothetical protein